MRYRWLMLAAVAVLSTGALNSERAGALTCGLTASQAVPIAPGGCHCPTGCQARIVALQLARSISEMPSFVGNSDGLAVALNASARDKKRPIAFSTEDVEKTLSLAKPKLEKQGITVQQGLFGMISISRDASKKQ
jgi:hypothetical protein